MPDLPAPPADEARLHAVIEALIFAAEEPLSLRELTELLPDVPEEQLHAAIEQLERTCAHPHRGLQVVRIAGGFRMTTKGDLGEWVRALFRSRNRRRLSPAAVETLAIVAYRQPITTPEIQSLRGTDPSGVLQNLLEKKLVRTLGRKKVVGKPILYGTTREFLTHFGLNSLTDLPSMEEFGEILSSMASAPEGTPAFEEGNGRDAGNGDDEVGEDDEDEAEREDDGDDS
ncbi:MAG TPA: SMC-Scp complex subunit ScpB [Verrucomicrobiae bacterium]|nr:SMC-Scp complex subunit ScpB [Verrucomicrobiae bacterium]